jgi:hypothetical protein
MFAGREVVITEKMDGENTTIYSDGACHARSVESRYHKSRGYVRGKAAEIGCHLPVGWRLVGENLFAQHSIVYNELPDFFVLFGVVDSANTARPWQEVEDWAELLDIPHVPVIWRGRWSTAVTRRLYPFASRAGAVIAEGYVVRVATGFPMDEFSEHVAKFVRRGHVQRDEEHWMSRPIIPNVRRRLSGVSGQRRGRV